MGKEVMPGLFVTPAKAGVDPAARADGGMDPGLRRDDGML